MCKHLKVNILKPTTLAKPTNVAETKTNTESTHTKQQLPSESEARPFDATRQPISRPTNQPRQRAGIRGKAPHCGPVSRPRPTTLPPPSRRRVAFPLHGQNHPTTISSGTSLCASLHQGCQQCRVVLRMCGGCPLLVLRVASVVDNLLVGC